MVSTHNLYTVYCICVRAVKHEPAATSISCNLITFNVSAHITILVKLTTHQSGTISKLKVIRFPAILVWQVQVAGMVVAVI